MTTAEDRMYHTHCRNRSKILKTSLSRVCDKRESKSLHIIRKLWKTRISHKFELHTIFYFENTKSTDLFMKMIAERSCLCFLYIPSVGDSGYVPYMWILERSI